MRQAGQIKGGRTMGSWIYWRGQRLQETDLKPEFELPEEEELEIPMSPAIEIEELVKFRQFKEAGTL